MFFVVGLLTSLFRGTDLVPTDVMAGCILLRVRQKRETLELRRLNILERPRYTIGKFFFFVFSLFWDKENYLPFDNTQTPKRFLLVGLRGCRSSGRITT